MYKGGQGSRCEELGACVRRGMHVFMITGVGVKILIQVQV